MHPNHIIHKQTVEVTFSNKSETHELFRHISNLFNRQISQCTERIMDEVVVGDMFISIDSIEIDLGSLTIPLNETELIKRYEMALEKTLKERIDKLHQRAASTEIGEAITEFCLTPVALLQHFLLKGNLPYWGGGAVMNKPEVIFNLVLEHYRDELKAMLLMMGAHPHVRVRLVNQFSLKLLHETISLIEPSQAPYIITYHKGITALQQREQIIKTEAALFEKSLWQFILTYLLVEMGSRFERKMFVQSSLSQMAWHYNLSYQEVLHLFGQVAISHQQMVEHHLTSLIVELMEEATLTKPLNKPLESFPFVIQDSNASDDEVLPYFLFYGTLPFRYQHYSATHVHSLLAREIKDSPVRLLQILNKHGHSQQLSVQLSQLPNALILEIVTLLEPTQTPFIENYHTRVMRVQKKTNILKTTEREFYQSLWHFIIAFLLNNQGSNFNTKAFVESNIRQLANHYNISFSNLLNMLAQGIGEEMLNVNSSSTLFHIVSEILRQQEASLPDEVAPKKNDVMIADTPDQETLRQRIALQNTLLYWLTQGYMPWWSRPSNLLPETLFANFVASHPQDAYLLLQQATQHGMAKGLLLRNMAPQIVTLLRQAPDGEMALSRIKLFEQVALQLKQTAVKEHVLETLFSALILTYHQSHFQQFELSEFLTNIIYLLKQALGDQHREVIKQMIGALKNQETSLSVSTANSLLKISKTEIPSVPLSLTQQNQFMPFDEQNLVVDGVVFSSVEAQEQLTMASDLVAYFLRHNRFPSTIAPQSEAQSNYLLQRLILLIYQLDSAKLGTLFNQPDDSPIARMRLHDIFAIQCNQQARNVVTMLNPYIEQHIIQFVGEICSNSPNVAHVGELLKWIDKNHNAHQRKKLYQSMMQSPSVAQHVATLYKGEAFWHVLRHLTSDKSMDEIKNHAYMLGLAIGDSFERELLQLHLREFSLGWFVGTSTTSMHVFFPHFLQWLAQKTSWSMLRLHEQLMALAPKFSNSNVEQQSLALLMQNQARQYANTTEHYHTIQATGQKQAQQLLEASLGHMAMPQSNNPSSFQLDVKKEPSSPPLKHDEGEKLFINNAGLVLIHPFLTTYLSRVGLTQGSEFNSIEAQHRATHLLQYLVNNAQQTPEDEMILNKVLCGLPIDAPIDYGIEITEHEKETASGLLNAVIQNWDKMKNSSVEGLQASFLQREGMLSENDEEWKLKIEQRTYDLLLQTLPWGLSMIKYPWMNKPLMIEWA